MADTLERLSRDSKYWTPKFHYNWPNVNSMMQQSEITVGPNIINQSDHPEDFAPPSPTKQNNMVSEWNGNVQQHWKAWEYVESDRSTNETLSNQQRSKTCNKTCRSCLCVFLMLSFIIAVIAAIGLTIFLTQFGYKAAQSTGNYSDGGAFRDVNLTEIQQSLLTKIFCGQLEDLLRSTEFPVEKGLGHCFAKILHMDTTGTIRIEMQATPVKGYTMIEKILRALNKSNKESIDSENKVIGSSTVNNAINKESTVIPNGHDISTFRDRSIGDSKTTSTGIISSTSFPVYDDWFTSTTVHSTAPEVTKDAKTPEVTKLSTKPEVEKYSSTQKVIKDSTTPEVPKDARTRDFITKLGTTTTKELSSTESQYVQSTTQAQISTTKEQPATVITDTVPTSTEFGEIHVPSSTNKPTSYTKMMTSSTRRMPENKLPVFKKPDRIELFKPSVDRDGNAIQTATISNSVPIRNSGSRSPQVVETLMTGGVIRLPLRTNSNFRFLFSGNSDSSRNDRQPPVNNKDTEVKVVVRRPVEP